MKKYSIYLLVTALLAGSCGNNNDTPTVSGDSNPNVQNVNGNMPDTSSSITLDKSGVPDTSVKKEGSPD